MFRTGYTGALNETNILIKQVYDVEKIITDLRRYTMPITPTVKCAECGHDFILGKTGVTTPAGYMCDACANVIRTIAGEVVESDYVEIDEDPLTDMESA